MTLVATLPTMTVDGAELLSERISNRLDTIAENYVKVMPLIREAISRNVHEVLGYASPGAYIKDRFGDALGKLGAELRREVVKELSTAGLSTRAIAPVVAVSQKTVVTDLQSQVIPEVSPAEDVPDLNVDASTGEVYEADDMEDSEPVDSSPRPVVGLDGKNYTVKPPAPFKPVPTGEVAAQKNAEQGALALAQAIFTLTALDFNDHRARLIDEWWPDGQVAVSPADRDLVNPKNFRRIAAGLTQLAYEWENDRG